VPVFLHFLQILLKIRHTVFYPEERAVVAMQNATNEESVMKLMEITDTRKSGSIKASPQANYEN